MHIIDLNRSHAKVEIEADICIVGAGAAGLFIAQRLARAGVRVVVAEAGDKRPSDTAMAGMSPLFSCATYSGATDGRFFGFGGSTSRWGGLLIPHSAHDIKPGSADITTWRRIVAIARERGPAVAQQLDLDDLMDAATAAQLFRHHEAARYLADSGLCAKYSAYLGFRSRNFAHCLRSRIWGSAGLTVLLNCIVTGWSARPSNDQVHLEVAHGLSPVGNRTLVRARYFILAAGAIETTRILLEMSREILPALQKTDLGLGLSDHLSIPIASIGQGADRRVFAPRFHRGNMYAIRFVGDECYVTSPRFFVHFVFDFRGTGVEVVKKVLSSLQAGRRPKVTLREAIKAASDVSKLAQQRFIRKELHFPNASRVYLQLDVEQERREENRIFLSDTIDARGRLKAVVEWDIRENDRANIRTLTERILSEWPKRPGKLPALLRLQESAYNAKPYDAYHPVGTCRMGVDKKAVVGLDSRVQGAENLFIVSTAVFPTAGTANPTFSMLCLGEELAHLLLAGMIGGPTSSR